MISGSSAAAIPSNSWTRNSSAGRIRPKTSRAGGSTQEGVAAIVDLPGTEAPVRVQDLARSLNRTVMNTGSFNAT